MHEITLAMQAVKTVLEFAEDNDIHAIDTVVLDIGELSLVVPEYMQDCWPAVVEDTMMRGAKLKINMLPGLGICKSCAEVYNIVENRGVCPKCGCSDKDVLCGQEFSVKEILIPD